MSTIPKTSLLLRATHMDVRCASWTINQCHCSIVNVDALGLCKTNDSLAVYIGSYINTYFTGMYEMNFCLFCYTLLHTLHALVPLLYRNLFINP